MGEFKVELLIDSGTKGATTIATIELPDATVAQDRYIAKITATFGGVKAGAKLSMSRNSGTTSAYTFVTVPVSDVQLKSGSPRWKFIQDMQFRLYRAFCDEFRKHGWNVHVSDRFATAPRRIEEQIIEKKIEQLRSRIEELSDRLQLLYQAERSER